MSTKPVTSPKPKKAKSLPTPASLSTESLLNPSEVIKEPESTPLPKEVKTVSTVPVKLVSATKYGGIETATSWNLKRRVVNDAYYAKFFIHTESYTDLNKIGIHLGVTWDEVLRGLVEQHLASSDPYTGLREFLPVYSHVPSL